MLVLEQLVPSDGSNHFCIKEKRTECSKQSSATI